jgi:hypothetical protein
MTFATRCWNCGSSDFSEGISYEECRSCGVACYYHGSGPNAAYKSAHERVASQREREQAERNRRWLIEHGYEEE